MTQHFFSIVEQFGLQCAKVRCFFSFFEKKCRRIAKSIIFHVAFFAMENINRLSKEVFFRVKSFQQ